MPDEILSLPSPSRGDDGYVELSRTRQGRLIRKKILPMNGSFTHPADDKVKIFVDKNMAESLKQNFRRLDFPVQVPIVNDSNQHVEDPLRNAGEVIDVDYDDTGVYATIDARKFADDFGKTILGASAFMHLNYKDTATGERIGPTLLHVAATNRPHVNGLGDYEDILKASADISDEQTILFFGEDEKSEPKPEETPVEEAPVVEEENVITEETETNSEDGQMTPEEMIAALKEHGIDVEALQGEATRAAELSGQLDAVNEQLRLSGTTDSEVSVDDLATAFVELSNANKEYATRIDTLETANAGFVKASAEREVDDLVKAGRVLPAQRDAMVELSLSNHSMFETLVPAEPIVSLSETGVTVHEEATRAEERQAKVADYATRAQKNRR